MTIPYSKPTLEDAADHVQWVCPRVLGCMVRICMVDRETARCAFIDYGQRCGPTRCVATAAQLAAPVEAPPEIFLLLKPGHYDILVPRAPSLWAACQAVLRCLEERLVTELRGKEPSGLEAFRRQLAAVVEPLHQLLQPQSAVPATRALLPALDGLLAPVGPAPKRAVRRRADCCVCIKGGAEITAKCAAQGMSSKAVYIEHIDIRTGLYDVEVTSRDFIYHLYTMYKTSYCWYIAYSLPRWRCCVEMRWLRLPPRLPRALRAREHLLEPPQLQVAQARHTP